MVIACVHTHKSWELVKRHRSMIGTINGVLSDQTYRLLSFLREPIDGGISPRRLDPEKYMKVRFVRFAMVSCHDKAVDWKLEHGVNLSWGATPKLKVLKYTSACDTATRTVASGGTLIHWCKTWQQDQRTTFISDLCLCSDSSRTTSKPQ